MKVVKFGGSSMADAGQYRKIRDILLADPERKVVEETPPEEEKEQQAEPKEQPENEEANPEEEDGEAPGDEEDTDQKEVSPDSPPADEDTGKAQQEDTGEGNETGQAEEPAAETDAERVFTAYGVLRQLQNRCGRHLDVPTGRKFDSCGCAYCNHDENLKYDRF